MRHIIAALALFCASAQAGSFPGSGEWPCFRANGALDGHASITGRGAQPQIVWKKFIGVIDSDYVFAPEGSPIPQPAPGVNDPRWGLVPQQGEAGGQSVPLEKTTTTTYAEVFPEAPGLERIEFESGFNKQQINGQWQPCVGRCFVWKDGAWAKAWETEPIELLFQPLPVVGDFDRDGAPEVAVLPWHELLIFDARSGRIEQRVRFTEGRSYGALYADDLDGDGLTEFVVLADFAKHIDALGYRDNKLQLLWRREIELTLDNPQKMLRAHPHPLADLNGDGRKELVVNLYNDSGDRAWHMLIFDGISGAVLADAPGEFMQTILDANGDGCADLLTARTNGINLPDFGTARIRTFKTGQLETLWERSEAGWQTWEPPVASNVNTAATRGREDVLARVNSGGMLATVRERDGDRIRLSLLHGASGGFVFAGSVAGPRLKAVALDAQGSMLFRATAPEGLAAAPTAEGGNLAPLGTSPRGFAGLNAPIVVREADARPLIVVQTSDDELAVLRATPDGAGAEELRRFPGRGQSTDWPTVLAPAAADLRGDGARQLVYATAAPEGHARLVAADLEGHELWHHDFPGIPGTPPVWNTGGITLWQPGHFTDAVRQDVLVTLRRTIMHTDETCLLSGVDGAELWHRTSQISGRGAGGEPFAVADYDGDGLDDAASFYPSLFYVLKGVTGADLIAMDATWPEVPVKPVYWGMPVAGDFEGKGKASVFFATTRRSMTGLVRPDGTLAWHDALDHSGTGYPAFGRFDRSGRLQAIVPGYDDGFRCYDTATGKVLWRVPAPFEGDPAGSASADLDGDGLDEALFTSKMQLVCIGASEDGSAGAVEWQMTLPTYIGSPVVADVDAGARATILLTGTDGCLYALR